MFEFAPITLHPVRTGPRERDRPRLGIARSAPDLVWPLVWREAPISACWKFAAARGAPATTLAVSMTIDAFGTTRDLAVDGANASLAACVRRALVDVNLTSTSSREDHLTATLAFERADQPAWPTLPPAPEVPRPPLERRSGVRCTPILDDRPPIEVRLPWTFSVSDADDSREPRGHRPPLMRVSCAITSLAADKAELRTALDANLGAFQACYADARDRAPGLVGDVVVNVTFDDTGGAPSARVTSGVGDPAFHACLSAAAAELWIAPPPDHGQQLVANFTLSLEPPRTAAADDPDALLAAGEADAALAVWGARLAAATTNLARCRARAGVIEALAQILPWLDDARLHAALRDLATAAAQLPREDAHACVARVAPVVARLVGVDRPINDFRRRTWVWLERYATALPLAPYLDDGDEVRWRYAEALRITPRVAEADALLEALATHPKIGAAVTATVKDRAHQATVPLGTGCW